MIIIESLRNYILESQRITLLFECSDNSIFRLYFPLEERILFKVCHERDIGFIHSDSIRLVLTHHRKELQVNICIQKILRTNLCGRKCVKKEIQT